MPLRPDNLVKAFFDDTLDPIGVADTDRRIVAVNKAFEREFGYSLSEIVGQSTEMFYGKAEDFRAMGDERYNVFAADQDDLYRLAYRRKSGETFIGETRSALIHDQDGNVVGFVAIVRNVSETVRREAAFSAIASVTADTHLPIAEKLRVLLEAARAQADVPAAALTVTGAYRSLFSGDGPLWAYAADANGLEREFDARLEACTRSLAECGSDPDTCHLEMLSIDGEILGQVCFLSATDTVPDLPGASEVRHTVLSTMASQIKLADQKRSLEASETRFRNLYRRTPAIMHSIDPTGILTEVSDEWLRVLGYERDAVVGRKSSDFLSPASRAYAQDEVLPKFWAQGHIERVPYTFMSRDGHPIEIELSGILDETRNSLAILENVTERNAAQRELLEKNQALELANEDMRQFAFFASHDLQEPLRKIQSFCDLLSESLETGNTDDIRYAMSVIRKSAARSSRLIADLLSFSRISNRPIEAKPFNALDAVNEAVETHMEAISAADAVVDIDVAPTTLAGDRSAFIQLIANLLGNAVKYRSSERQAHVHVSLTSEEEDFVVRVEDNGIGIEPQHHKVIFEAFRRLHPQSAYDGTGIGLAIGKKAADRLGWDLTVERSSNAGTVFRLVIPAENRP